ncbi:hypothetical protein KEM56_003605 [Ascosphaera pollenicola]|nr:hypothetical protein KEM56_003605 [Ascosphaera pollenicola]
MTSKFMSRLVNTSASPSVYETIRQDDKERQTATGGDPYLDLDEENLGGQYHDEELAEALADTETETTSVSRAQEDVPRHVFRSAKGKGPEHNRQNYAGMSSVGDYNHIDAEADDDDDEVPPSLLVEGDKTFAMHDLPPRPSEIHEHIININNPADKPGPSQRAPHLRWQDGGPTLSVPPVLGGGLAAADPRDKAMWRWTNVENLDNYLMEVYAYFQGNGIRSICLRRLLNLFLFWIGKAFQYTLDVVRLSHMHDFYYYLLGVSDTDIQTISWQEVVSRLMTLRDLNPATAQAVSPKYRKFIGSQSKQRMDAQDIANRLMRKENYLIALFNKDILDLTLPIPFLKHRQLFSHTLEWNLNICILDFVFNEQGQLRPVFLRESHRKPLSEALRRRFVVVGIINIFIAPFLVIYFLLHHFFRYFNEYQKNPSLVGSRQYTPLAEWKFREFNELWHLFQRRINMSYPFATRYIDQFPKDKTVQVARFVGFVAGAIASVLALASVIDPELFLGFEITHDRTVLFYLGFFGSIWAVARGMVPEKTLVFDPEFALREVIDYTHYQPAHWKGKLHSDEVKRDFAVMYQMKVVIFLEEILSMIFAPFVLCFSLPHCSDRIIDFFREFTIHVDGLGYICSFAEFNFQKGANAIPQERPRSGHGATDPRENYFATKDNKMLASYFGFLDNYGDNCLAPGHHPHSRQRRFPFNAEPPGLASSHLRSESNDPSSPPFGTFGQPPRHAVPPQMRSVLLDPHHQPAASGFRPTPLHKSAMLNSRRNPLRTPLHQGHAFPTFHGAVPTTRKTHGQSPLMAGLGIDDNDTDNSWRSFEDNDDDDDDHRDDMQAVIDGPGVLGLVKQLQKAAN